jgi:hypothetical protein
MEGILVVREGEGQVAIGGGDGGGSKVAFVVGACTMLMGGALATVFGGPGFRKLVFLVAMTAASGEASAVVISWFVDGGRQCRD